MKDLESLRREVDLIDTEISKLFSKRLDLVKDIKKEKTKRGLMISDIKRENEILTNLEDNTKSEYFPYSQELFKDIIKISKDFQEQLNE